MITRVLLVSRDRTLIKRFDAIRRARTFRLEELSEVPSLETLRSVKTPTLVYIDTAIQKDARKLAQIENKFVGIAFADRKRLVKDPGRLFHQGAFDYLGLELLSEEITSARIRDAAAYLSIPEPAETTEHASPPEVKNASGKDWTRVRTGREYSFVFLYIEIDLINEWRKKSGKKHLDEVTASFLRHVNRFIAPVDGKVWMWTNTGGLILIPFDGEQCPIIEACMKIVFDRVLISAEHYSYNTIITYRTALHIGSTIYESRGNTGKIVSDTVNFMFHLGQKRLHEGDLVLTDSIVPYVPGGLGDCFVEAGLFEGTTIHRMRLPVR